MVRYNSFFNFILSLGCAFSFAANNDTTDCDESTMDEFAYEDCMKGDNSENADKTYSPFRKDAYLTSSFGENRGTRYHAGIDYSTQMEEGWPIYAPENGYVKELRVSPFGYGKVMFFKGKSGKTWVFAHQSSFGRLDMQVSKKRYATKKNDVTVSPGTYFKKGDTLSFAGSTGIGNPHLHLEVRLDNDRIISPCQFGALCIDTIAPQIFGLAVWQGNDLAITNDSALSKGCAVTPVKNEFNLSVAVKIADYSREPKDNPMAVRRIDVWRYDEHIYHKLMDTLRYSKMNGIREQLLWAEEADTAGDWHFIDAKFAPLSTYKLEIEDFSGHVTTRKFTFHPKCKGNSHIEQTKNQTAPVYTFLSRPMIDLFRCRSGYTFTAIGAKEAVLDENLCKTFPNRPILLGKILDSYPELTAIRYTANAESTGDGHAADNIVAVYPFKKYQTSVSWNTKLGNVNITQKITGIPVGKDTTHRILAVLRTHTDSLDFFEFHPKGLPLKNWNVCIDDPYNHEPLYWLGETTRDWFYFSKQSGKTKHCANTNELRDLAGIKVEEPISLGFPYWANDMIEGISQPVLKIPVQYKYGGIPDGNAITVKAGYKWIAADYDSEPREIVLEGTKIPEEGETLTIEIVDEAKNKMKFNVNIPGM